MAKTARIFRHTPLALREKGRGTLRRSQVFAKEEEDDLEALVEFRPSWHMILQHL